MVIIFSRCFLTNGCQGDASSVDFPGLREKVFQEVAIAIELAASLVLIYELYCSMFKDVVEDVSCIGC